jgi:hypothetical protein
METMNNKIMNQIVKAAALKQNDKLKLNAGQWREAISIIFETLHGLDLSVIKSTGKDTMKKTSAKKATKKVVPKKK